LKGEGGTKKKVGNDRNNTMVANMKRGENVGPSRNRATPTVINNLKRQKVRTKYELKVMWGASSGKIINVQNSEKKRVGCGVEFLVE